MNLHMRSNVLPRADTGATSLWCLGVLLCAALGYYLLDPVASARARLNDCVSSRMTKPDDSTGTRPVNPTDREQALSSALYACSVQP